MNGTGGGTRLRGGMRRTLRPVVWPVYSRVKARMDHLAVLRVQQLDAELRPQLDLLRTQLAELRDTVEFIDDVLHRIGPHIAAIEERLTTVTDTAGQRFHPATDGDAAEAVAVLEEVRAEHARIRARLTMAARYEERVARLEAAVRRD